MSFRRLVLAGALLAIWVLAPDFHALAQGASQVPSTATLPETLDWIKTRIDGERIDSVGIRVRTSFRSDGCRVYFLKDIGTLKLITGSFGLKDIAYVYLVDQPVGSQWTGTFLIFRSASGQSSITRGDLWAAEGRLQEWNSSSFEWWLGSVPVGASTADLHQLGDRLRKAFLHAVGLCGGTIKKEPF